MKLYWEAFDELVLTNEILKYDHNPVYQYENQLIDGAIVDIGCGQSPILLKYAGVPGRKIIGIDSEEFQLEKLYNRLKDIPGYSPKQCELIASDIQHGQLPPGIYSLVNLYNILHFFTLNDCKAIIPKLAEHLVKGSLISVSVHSSKYYANDPEDPTNNDYFKNYFTYDDLDELFPANHFDTLYRADIERSHNLMDKTVCALWAEKMIVNMNITNKREKANLRKICAQNNVQADLVCVFIKI